MDYIFDRALGVGRPKAMTRLIPQKVVMESTRTASLLRPFHMRRPIPGTHRGKQTCLRIDRKNCSIPALIRSGSRRRSALLTGPASRALYRSDLAQSRWSRKYRSDLRSDQYRRHGLCQISHDDEASSPRIDDSTTTTSRVLNERQ